MRSDTPANEDEPDVEPGTDLVQHERRRIGRYVVLYPLGEGGMGKVYAAHDPHLDRRVALKVMRTRKSASFERARERILAEAQALAKLSHPNVVAVHDVGIVGDALFMAVDLVEGLTLRRWWQRSPRPLAAVLDVFRQAAHGLAAAHAAGIVHRDFKPDNAIVGNDGRVHVIDFGLAEAWSELEILDSSQRITSVSAGATASAERPRRIGTPSYMAPEQHLGLAVGPATDQFAFCVSLYEALYERLPFEGSGETLVATVTNGKIGELPRDRRVPAWLRRAVLRGLAPDPARRHPSMNALARALRPPRRSPMRVMAGAGLITSLGLVGAWAVADRLPAPATADCPTHESPWTEDARASVREALEASASKHAVHTADRVVAELDAYALAWIQSERDACAASPHAPRERDARLACLADRQRHLRALVDELRLHGASVLDHATRATARLPRIETCAHASPLRDVPETRKASHDGAPPRREGPRGPSSGLDPRQQLAHAAALLGTGRVREGVALADAVAERARVLEDPVLLAAASLLHADGLEATHEPERAAEVLREAALTAERAGDDGALLDARIALVRVLAMRPDALAEGELWSRLARATLDRLGGDPVREAALERALGLLYASHDRSADAVVHAQKAVALVEAEHGDRARSPRAQRAARALREAEARDTLARTLAAAGRHDEAIEAELRARAAWAEMYGP